MAGQDQKAYEIPKPADGLAQDANPGYRGPRKLEGVKDLLAGVDDLVHKGNLAKDYHQSGGQ